MSHQVASQPIEASIQALERDLSQRDVQHRGLINRSEFTFVVVRNGGLLTQVDALADRFADATSKQGSSDLVDYRRFLAHMRALAEGREDADNIDEVPTRRDLSPELMLQAAPISITSRASGLRHYSWETPSSPAFVELKSPSPLPALASSPTVVSTSASSTGVSYVMMEAVAASQVAQGRRRLDTSKTPPEFEGQQKNTISGTSSRNASTSPVQFSPLPVVNTPYAHQLHGTPSNSSWFGDTHLQHHNKVAAASAFRSAVSLSPPRSDADDGVTMIAAPPFSVRPHDGTAMRQDTTETRSSPSTALLSATRHPRDTESSIPLTSSAGRISLKEVWRIMSLGHNSAVEHTLTVGQLYQSLMSRTALRHVVPPQAQLEILLEGIMESRRGTSASPQRDGVDDMSAVDFDAFMTLVSRLPLPAIEAIRSKATWITQHAPPSSSVGSIVKASSTEPPPLPQEDVPAADTLRRLQFAPATPPPAADNLEVSPAVASRIRAPGPHETNQPPTTPAVTPRRFSTTPTSYSERHSMASKLASQCDFAGEGTKVLPASSTVHPESIEEPAATETIGSRSASQRASAERADVLQRLLMPTRSSMNKNLHRGQPASSLAKGTRPLPLQGGKQAQQLNREPNKAMPQASRASSRMSTSQSRSTGWNSATSSARSSRTNSPVTGSLISKHETPRVERVSLAAGNRRVPLSFPGTPCRAERPPVNHADSASLPSPASASSSRASRGMALPASVVRALGGTIGPLLSLCTAVDKDHIGYIPPVSLCRLIQGIAPQLSTAVLMSAMDPYVAPHNEALGVDYAQMIGDVILTSDTPLRSSTQGSASKHEAPSDTKRLPFRDRELNDRSEENLQKRSADLQGCYADPSVVPGRGSPSPAKQAWNILPTAALRSQSRSASSDRQQSAALDMDLPIEERVRVGRQKIKKLLRHELLSAVDYDAQALVQCFAEYDVVRRGYLDEKSFRRCIMELFRNGRRSMPPWAIERSTRVAKAPFELLAQLPIGGYEMEDRSGEPLTAVERGARQSASRWLSTTRSSAADNGWCDYRFLLAEIGVVSYF